MISVQKYEIFAVYTKNGQQQIKQNPSQKPLLTSLRAVFWRSNLVFLIKKIASVVCRTTDSLAMTIIFEIASNFYFSSVVSIFLPL